MCERFDCHCFNPENCCVEETLPPLVPAAVPKPKPIFSSADIQDLIKVHKDKKRDKLTTQYQHHLNDAIDELLELRGDTLKEEMRELVEQTEDVDRLHIVLYRYARAVPLAGQDHAQYTDDDGNWWSSVASYCRSITTTLGGVEVDFIVRQTHFLRQLRARIGDLKHFIIKKHVHVPEETDTHKVYHMTLWLEFWPKGVTERRVHECDP